MRRLRVWLSAALLAGCVVPVANPPAYSPPPQQGGYDQQPPPPPDQTQYNPNASQQPFGNFLLDLISGQRIKGNRLAIVGNARGLIETNA